ncbi:MAG TPA: M20 family metallo-hydrolase [Spirochaetota bacterium]|jgi:succinyl-diaminopimelate desuccinylase|nr:MAG: Succinyl-diaminopimelate desuccinylase [Spirochaetes bacterium ADurb.Bin133]HPY87764.1 M20 family metallo-hydrolase [Spirochaetota bacterium]HQB61663.1 M20 family metallo-hydrolase [Spirochaetota bacterium]
MKRILDQIENGRDFIIELQKGLTRIPAIAPENGGEGEYDKFIWLKNYIKDWGFDKTEEILVPDLRIASGVRPTLITTINGICSEKTLWLITHLDVVPVGEIALWDTEPFEAVVDGDKIFGRGTEDNQQSLVSALLAAKTLLDNRIKPHYDVKLVFVADEEVGSGYGIDWILKNRVDLFKKDDLIITPDVGDPDGRYIEIAEKSILWVEFKIVGEQSHGSRPDKAINAARASSHLAIRIDNLRFKYNGIDDLYDVPYSTFEPTRRASAVTNINTIPGEETLAFDCRILPQYNILEILEEMKKIASSVETEFGVKITITTPQFLQAPPPTPENAEVVVKLKNSIKKITGTEPELTGIGGGTVAAYFRMKNFPAALWSTVDNTMHSPNEYSSIKNTIKDAKVFADLMTSE